MISLLNSVGTMSEILKTSKTMLGECHALACKPRFVSAHLMSPLEAEAPHEGHGKGPRGMWRMMAAVSVPRGWRALTTWRGWMTQTASVSSR
jgi:hypothetical protein